MRLAIVSDIHGNLPALDAVLADIARRGADLTLDCGDLLSGPLWPKETADLLMALGLPTIRGNHERQLLACADAPGSASDRYAYAQTTPAQRDWLAALPGASAQASSWRSWLPRMVGMASAISRSAVSRGHSGPLSRSPQSSVRSAPRRAMSASTASSAGRLPWMSETMARRMAAGGDRSGHNDRTDRAPAPAGGMKSAALK